MLKNREVMRMEWLKRLFCLHRMSPNLFAVKDDKGRRRHAYICSKCGKREYVD